MKSERDRPEPPSAPLDDDQIGALVRAVADDWQMPPQRLDRPTWRDLTARGGPRRRGRLARVAGPAVAAVLATVAVAFVAVWLTSPRPHPAVSGASPGDRPPTPARRRPGRRRRRGRPPVRFPHSFATAISRLRAGCWCAWTVVTRSPISAPGRSRRSRSHRSRVPRRCSRAPAAAGSASVRTGSSGDRRLRAA